MSKTPKDYRVISAEKKLQQQSKIPKEWILLKSFDGTLNVMNVPLTCGILSEEEYRITSNFDATALLEKIKMREWSAEQVTVAFCKRAAIAHQLTNCLTEIFFDKAIQRARELDHERESNPDTALRPLHGLPVSLKDSYQVKGYDTSTGLGCFVDEPAGEHSGTAAMLLDLGAVLYCKTNLPQSIMTGDSHNNIFGRTVNPRNTALTAGGSTGGEGALITLRGSIFGIGTDIGGSIRIPSHCNGIYGYRPSVGIVPHSGVRDLTTPGTDGVYSSAGPMATSLRDISMFIETVMRAGAWKFDSAAVSVPWTKISPKDKVRIGLVLDNGIHTPNPPIRRGLKKASELLQKNADIEIIPITLPNVVQCLTDLLQYYTLSGPENYLELFARTGEPVIPSLEGSGFLTIKGTDLRGYFALNVRRQAAAKEYLKLFRSNNLDAILMPPAPHTATPHDKWGNLSYTGLWNYLDYPAVAIPVDIVNDSDLPDDISNAKFGAEDERTYALYTGPEQYKDAPIGVQLVGYRHADEALMHTAALVDSIINGVEKTSS